MFTSLGYHTFTIFRRLTIDEAVALLREFKRHRNETGEIRVRPARDGKGDIIPNFHIIEYINGNKGITWTITYNYLLGEKPYSIKAKVNPKILIGTNDYIEAANSDYLEKVEALFNDEIKKLSPILGEFRWYSLSRIDYCINFDVKELGLNCSPERIIKLIKQSDIPTHFTERTEYDKTSRRTKTDKFSFYLMCNSAVVNCYWKHWQLSNVYPDCPDLEASLNVIRFEIQCLYPKVYSMSKLIRDSAEFYNVKDEMLSDDVSTTIIRNYFNKVIGRGNYYTLDMARKMIEHQNFSPKKKDRLILDLKLINYRQGIYKAKAVLHDKELDDFNRSLRELAAIGINPVTIPKDWGIKCIPNLLDAYDRKMGIEYAKERIANDYFKELRKKNPKPKKIKKPLLIIDHRWIESNPLD